MTRDGKKIKVLMCCSDLSVKGGMVTVLKNYLAYDNWEEYEINYIPTHIEKSKIYKILYFLKAYIKILILALTNNIDIAYLHTAERGSVFRKAIILGTMKKFGIKTVLHHHAAEFDEFYDSLSEKKKKYVSDTLMYADLNIVLSQRLISMIKEKSPNAKVAVLYNSVKTYDTNVYNPDGKYIMFLGRLGKRKGTYDLLLAIKKIDCVIDKRYRFLLCGDGEIEEIKEKVKALQLENRIEHIGWIDLEQKEMYYKNVILNVLPSYNEGLPMTILETMAYGIPNISTDIASIPEVIKNGENGYMITPGDIDNLAEKISFLINNRNVRVSFSNSSWNCICTKFSRDKNMEELKQLLREL